MYLMFCKDLEGNVPKEIQVIPYGYSKTSKGDFLLDEESAGLVMSVTQINDMVIDFEHQTLTGQEAPAAGWIKELVNKGKEGIWAVVEWTEKAKQYIANKEYRYVSPVFLVRQSDKRVMRLFNVALTNQPNIDGMVPLINKVAGDQWSVAGSKNKTEEERSMKKVLEVLGLAEGATEDAVVAAINTLKQPSQVVASKAVIEALGLKEGAAESEVTGTIMAMKQSHTQTGDLAGKVKELSDKLAARDADDLVAMAMKEGKVTAAQKPWAEDYAKKDPEGFKVFVAKAAVVVPMGDAGSGAGDSGHKGLIDETTLMVAKMFGTTEEDLKKTLGA